MRRRRRITAYIGMGSNLGDRKANIDKAIECVKRLEGVEVTGVSSVYETDSVGGPPQGKFLNGVFEIKTSQDPFELLTELKRVERLLGRKKGARNEPRPIDLDILFFGNKKVNTEKLKIPHPRIQKREFVLRGLRELGANPV